MKIKVNIKSAFLLLFMVAMSSFALAQRTISGAVKDADSGEPLVGASVVVTGTTKGTLTDVDGNYTLDVPNDAKTLTFSFTGYSNLTVSLGASNVIDAALKGGTVLDQVVVVGYGSLQKKEVTSSVTSLKSEDFNRGNVNDPAQLLQGKVAGLSIGRAGSDPNSGFSIRLRGLSTIGASAEPLVIIDGVPGATLSSVDPNDIETIDVLKDGAAAAIYGTRGTSGVILITTKKGKTGKTSVEYNGMLTAESIARSVSVMTADEFKALNQKLGNSNYDKGSSTNWLDQVTRTGITNVHNLAMSGGVNNTTYRAVINYRGVEGIALNDGFKQINGRLTLNQKALNDKLTVNTDISATTKTARYGFSEAFRYALQFNPTAPINDAQGKYTEFDLFDYFNPVAIAKQGVNEGKENTILASIRGEYELATGLKAALMYSENRKTGDYGEYYGREMRFRGVIGNPVGGGGLARVNHNASLNRYVSSTLNYIKDFGSFTMNALAGYDYQYFQYSGSGMENGQFLTDIFGYNNIGSGLALSKGLGTMYSYKNDETLIAGFARATFNFNDKFFATATVRREGSSRFGINNRWGWFPAVSAGVDITKFTTIKGIDNLKVRASYGITGNRPGESYLSQERYRFGSNFFYNGAFVPSVGPWLNANPDLKWETKGEANFGIDFAMLNSKLSGSIDLFSRNTKDLIYNISVPVPPNLAPNTWANVGEMSNRGVEVVVNYKAIDKKDFKWTTSANFSTVSNKLVTLSNDALGFKFSPTGFVDMANLGAPGQNGVNLIRVQENAPIGQIVALRYAGVDDQGRYIVLDSAGNQRRGDQLLYNPKDAAVVGNGLPTFTMGWNNSFTFGKFDFNIFMRGAFGHSLVNEYRAFYETATPGEASARNRVKTSLYDERVKQNPAMNSYHVEKADFWRIENASLGYNVTMPKNSWFNRCRLSLTANNLATFTNYTGVDPEVRYGDVGTSDSGGRPSLTSNPLLPGIDRRSTYFITRSFVFGVNLGF